MDKIEDAVLVFGLIFFLLGLAVSVIGVYKVPQAKITYGNISVQGFDTHVYGCKVVAGSDNAVYTFKLPCTLRDTGAPAGYTVAAVILVSLGILLIIVALA